MSDGLLNEKERDELLVENRLIYLTGRLNAQKVEKVKTISTDLVLSSRETVLCIIDSEDGDPEHCLHLYDHIKMTGHSLPIYGLVMGKCGILATAILQACQKRFATKNSFFHLKRLQGNFCFSVENSYLELKSWLCEDLKWTQLLDKKIEKIILSRSKMNSYQYQELTRMNGGKLGYTTTVEALNLGIIDKIK
ncbi:MAG: ATP-dependent Clp protease proteolytic subunit [Candidatus Paceibacterota bacterium]